MKASRRLSNLLASGTHGRNSSLRIFRAPARINLIGEHTDYNDGFVLPTNTGLYTWVTVCPRDDRRVSVTSLNLGQTEVFDLEESSPPGEGGWLDYVRGVAMELQREGLPLRGAELVIDSDIPIGSGLSSSAALELAVGHALLALSNQVVPLPELARICQRAEHNFAGVNCGIMDQFSIACARESHALLLDCRSLATVHVPIPASVGLIVTDSGVRHRLPDGEYGNRAAECAAALAILAREEPGISSLRDVDRTTLSRHENALEAALFRRCRHVVTENERVQQMVTALGDEDLEAIGQLVTAGHRSISSDFEASCPEVDALVALANRCPDVFGSRMIGGGFGGCVLSVVAADRLEKAADAILAACVREFGREPWMHKASPAPPAMEIAQP
jgi:galactokinase